MIERGDLVNLLGVDETPWRVIEYDEGIDYCGEKARNYGYGEFEMEIDPISDSYSLVAKADDLTDIKVLPTSKVKKPHESAWFLAGET